MRLPLFLLLSTISIFSRSQKPKEELFYVFDKTWRPCNIDSAQYLSFVQKFDDTTWQWNNYHFLGNLITIETFKDKEATKPHGYFAYFDKQGKIDSSGKVYNGLKDGEWYIYGDSIKPQIIHEYAMGRFIKERKTADRAVDTTKHFDEREADFKGGIKAWINYLQNNIKFPKRAEDKNIKGTAAIAFVVTESGKTENPFIVRSVEFSIDQEALRLIKASPAWAPAQQDGRKVRAYRIQPITFAYR